MDYDRIEKLSKKLGGARLQSRISAAENILTKLKNGIELRESTATILDGICSSLEGMVKSPSDLTDLGNATGELLDALFQIIQRIPTRDYVEPATKILELLYQLETVDGLTEKLKKGLKETVDAICSVDISANTRPDVDLLERRALELINQNKAPLHDESVAKSTGRMHGAGAILTSRLVHSGWKFPPFLTTKQDDEWLFDVQHAVMTRRECGARGLWAVLAELPAPALLGQTNLLRAVIDLVGAPVSQTDIDADPLGLHHLTALRWLERLLGKCREAFRVQLDGSMCSSVPAAPHSSLGADVDLATGLAQAMYQYRHPQLPTETVEATNASPSLAALYPTPSFPGLAFACCAAALPLLEGQDSAVCRAVHSLLRTALPFVLEPQLEGSSGGALLNVEHARLQYLFRRTEQILAFHESSFDMGKFMALMMSEDAADSANTSPAEQREHAARSVDTLRTSSCQLLLLASAVEVFGAAPAHSLLPCAAVDDGSGSKLAVGPLSLACLRRLTACRTSLETLLPGATATAERCLTILDPAMLECIRSAEQSLYCAKAFTQSVPAETGDAEELLPALVARAEMAVDLLDQDCPISAPRLQDALVGALPILLLACCESESDFSAEAQTLLAMIVRVLSCGRDTSKSLLLQHLMSWMACTGRVALSEPLLGLVRLFELQPRHGRHLVLLLSTPAVVQALVTDTYLAQENADGALSLAAVDLLELICGELNRREIDRSALEDWAAVLLPLKTLEWDPAQANKSQSARFQFTRRLQDCCGEFRSSGCSNAFGKSIVLGMFHQDSAVRINSVLRVRRDILGVALPLGLDGTGEGGVEDSDSPLGLLTCDLFLPGAPQRLAQWRDHLFSACSATKRAAGGKVSAVGSLTHADVRKVASIGLGDCDAPIRASALVQLLEMLQSDAQLVRTAEAEWVRATAQQAIQQLVALAPLADAEGVICSASRAQNMSDAECRLLVELARVVEFLFAHYPHLRSSAAFVPGASEVATGISVKPLLRLLLAGTHAKTSNPSALSALHRVSSICAQVLCFIVCSAHAWAPLRHREESTAHLSVTHAFEAADEEVEIPACAVHVPAFLIARYQLPVPSAGLSNEYARTGATKGGKKGAATVAVTAVGRSVTPLEFALVQLSCAPALTTSYPPDDVVAAIIAEVVGTASERVHVETATKLFGLIVRARNHAQLREAMSCTLCVCATSPALLHAFLYLQLNFITAVSSIITVDPTTHKDHITLAAALGFLQTSFAALLAQESSLPGQLAEEVVAYHNETSAAILAHMTAYFAAHFQQANTFFVGLTAASETEKEHATASHAVCSAYFHLLHTLSAFRLPGLQLGAHMTGNLITSLLVHIAISELHRAHDRAVALSTLENLVRFHGGGWQAVASCGNPHLTSIFGSALRPSQIPQLRSPSKDRKLRDAQSSEEEAPIQDRKLRDAQSSEEEAPIQDHVVRAVKLLRAPDSMQGSSAVIGLLRLLHACLLREQEQGVEYSSAEESREQWKWLVRLMYDRRSDVKILAVEILSCVLKSVRVSGNDASSTAADSLDRPLNQKAAELPTEAASDAAAGASWPPIEQLELIIADSSESAALRVRAVELLVHLRTRSRDAEQSPRLGPMLSAIFDLLSTRDNSMASAASTLQAVSALSSLITSADQQIVQEALTQAKSMKVLPLVVEVLNVRIQAALGATALSRVSIWDEQYVSSDRTSFFHGDALPLRTAARASAELQGAGWSAVQKAHMVGEVDALRACRTCACWLLFQLDRADAALFEQCIQHTNLVRYLATCFSAVSQPVAASSAFGSEFEYDSVAAQAELLSMLIARVGAGASVNGPDSAGTLQDCLGKNGFVPGNLLKKILVVLLGMKDLKGGSRSLDTQLRAISACLRLLSLMLNEPLWRSQLGLDGTDGRGALSDPCAYLFDLLLAMRTALADLHKPVCPPLCEQVSAVQAVVSRADFAIALFMQWSYAARVAFVQYNIERKQAAARSSPGESQLCLLEQYVRTIHSASEAVSAIPVPASAKRSSALPGAGASVVSSVATPAPARGKAELASTVSPEAQRSLQNLKAKTTAKQATPAANPASAPANARASKVSQSMSSWATRTSASSRWRDKSRSFQWNKDRSNGGAAASPASEDALSDASKLSLWTALLVLAAAFPGCEETVDWAIELQLHHDLNRLLRFAAVHSMSALLGSVTAGQSFLFALPLAGDGWAPSGGMLSTAVASLCCAFTHQHPHAKQCFASVGEAAAAVIGASSSVSSLPRGRISGAAPASSTSAASLHHLISLGTNRGAIPVVRWLYLNLAGSVLSGAQNLGAPALKTAFSQMIALTLQRSLHASHADPDAVVPLLTALTCFLSAEDDISLLSQLSRKDHGAAMRSFQLTLGLVADPAGGGKGTEALAEEFKPITFPELLKWIWGTLGHQPEVAAAVCKIAGRIAVVDQGHRAVGNLLSDDVLAVLCKCYTAAPLKHVRDLATLALWTALHYSEKAKGVVREILASLPAPSSLQGADKENALLSNAEGIAADEETEDPVLRGRAFIEALRVCA